MENSKELDGKVVIVTGANGDIGQPLVAALLEQGYQVGACVRNIFLLKYRTHVLLT